MALQRRNPAATYEQPAAEAATATAPAPTAATAPPTPSPAATVAAAATQPASQPAVAAKVDVSGTAQATGPASVAQTAMVRREANAGAVALARPAPVLEDRKNVFPVDYDTFDRLKSGSGVIVDSNNNSLGDEIAMTVLSWQDTYDISPGKDTPEAKKVVRFSDDGVTVKGTGQLVQEYLTQLRTGEVDGVPYPDASVKAKKVVVGILEGASKDTNLLGKTVQVSLSQQSAKSFDRHRFDISVNVMMGKRANADGAEKILIKAVAKSGNGRNWTQLEVSEDK